MKERRRRQGYDTVAMSKAAVTALSLEASVFDGCPDPLAIFEPRGRLIAVNAAARTEGAPDPAGAEEALGQLLPFWGDSETRDRLLSAALDPNGASNVEVRVTFEDSARNKVFWVSARRLGDSEPALLVASARNVSAAHALTRETARNETLASTHASRDPVTGFVTRAAFQELLEKAIEHANRGKRPLALLFFDLDDFKALNDTHGLAAGDEYLRRLGEALSLALRPGRVFARLGGDEFGLLSPDTTSAEAALEADNLVRFLTEFSPTFEGRRLQITASVGVAVYPAHGQRASDLMLAADLAMHQAKARGRARFILHDPNARERERIGLLRGQADRIRIGLSAGRFVPLFQPISEVSTGRIVAAETLVRLREEDGSLTSPDEFLDAAERFGFVTAIDRVVIGSTFDALIAARKRISPDLEVSINLSGLDFEDDALVADISRLARLKGIRPSRITFEITETAALRDLGRVQDFTNALTSEGFKFALDDFGVGFSSFRYLRDLPMSTLKFDQSYVRDLPLKMENRVFVRGIAEICRGFGVKTVAEGVETPEILTILRELGVDRAQGYYIGHPALELPARPGEPG
ncbi:MAG: bifunctional diguanylate cyclase/phosphodiesterase [Holophagales bacterium]|nr:bifunctional diguanylate cyclase/phosphodiesterase [Holophagales bacterium]